jgi:hypothetical protein
VLALTARGFGASSQSESGHEISRMVQDKVLDALKLPRVHLVGRPIAGDELSAAGATSMIVEVVVPHDRSR